ncbi:GNAT family N-acetyltransferase [Streptosporangium carneum]|uniref:Succinyl-CoA transferase n=1 Tax=Streptosporangium carneum TaxID=47481 RepID=A0A9W6MBZ7_9ACTN|nr:GNAT family protein [Streptosporangium carneum]GLK08320.1 putative succinyl-CoA transferase [Streptosporangium carneum]
MRNWPLFRLRLTTPRLELRLPSLDDLDDLGDRAAEGVHDPDVMPFVFPWTHGEPADRARTTVQYHFRAWGEWSPESWKCPFVVVFEGQVVGTQELAGTDFGVTREVFSGSWLGRRFHGMGIGTEMRAAVLHLAFHGLGARYATSGAFTDNPASLAISRKLGYAADGVQVHNRLGEPAETLRLRLSRDDWTTPAGFLIHDLEPCLPLFGVSRTA